MIERINPEACPDCLRRSRLLAHLAPYIEKIATGAPGQRSPELLCRLAGAVLLLFLCSLLGLWI